MEKIALMLILLLTLTSCSVAPGVGSINLMAGINPSGIGPVEIPGARDDSTNKTSEITGFALNILRGIDGNSNLLISPLSIASALSMTANGAQNETLSQMESVLGGDIDDLNKYLHAYRLYLPTGEEYKVSLANSIWFRDAKNLTVEETFLQTNKDYYDAEVYKAPFDERTKDEINAWVNEKTNGLIDRLLDEAPPGDTLMYLINALSFDAQWQNIYEVSSVHQGKFTSHNGDSKTVDFMHSTERGYIELPGAVGFSKPYADSKYCFVALLPDEGLKVADLIESMDGGTLIDAFKNRKHDEVRVSMPKFEFEYAKELSGILQDLGMNDAFSEGLADFGSLGRCSDGNIFVNRVIHKTKIRVDEKGTEAGAVTGVQMGVTSVPLERKVIHLDRPFFFMIVDAEFGLPIFMGILNDTGS